MRAAIAAEPGGPDVLRLEERPDAAPGPGEVAIDVAASAINRADTLQRRGLYRVPPGASDVLGLECSGVVAEVGDGVTEWQAGDEVCALLTGGGNATRVVCPAGQVMPVPDGVDLVTAAALPEVVCTVWSNVFMVAGLKPEEAFLVHGGAGGIGTMAIQLAREVGARVFATAGSEEKLATCTELGADVAINYREQDFVEVVREKTGGAGVDVVLDNMGAKYLGRNVDALATEGRLVIIGLQGGVKGELDIANLMSKQGAVIGTLLRPRPVEEKARICRSVVEHVWPLVSAGRVKAVVAETFPLDEISAAHELMESGGHTGKIVLTAGGH